MDKKMCLIDLTTHDEYSETHAKHLVFTGYFEGRGIWIRRLNGKKLPSRRAVIERHRRHAARQLLEQARQADLRVLVFDGHLAIMPECRAAGDAELLAGLHQYRTEILKILSACGSKRRLRGPETSPNAVDFQGEIKKGAGL